MPDPQKKFRWNARAARYVEQRTGRFVKGVTIRDAVDDALAANRARMLTATNSMRAGRMSLPTWHRTMRQGLKTTHLYSAAAAKGGWAQLGRKDLGYVREQVQRQSNYLDNFARQIQGGLPLDGQVTARASMYAMSGRETFHLVERDDKASAGYQFEKNHLTAVENCSGCVMQSARGRVPIGSLVPLGERNCRSNCKCWVEYSL